MLLGAKKRVSEDAVELGKRYHLTADDKRQKMKQQLMRRTLERTKKQFHVNDNLHVLVDASVPGIHPTVRAPFQTVSNIRWAHVVIVPSLGGIGSKNQVQVGTQDFAAACWASRQHWSSSKVQKLRVASADVNIDTMPRHQIPTGHHYTPQWYMGSCVITRTHTLIDVL